MKYVIPATPRHARHVAAFLRPADALEVRLSRPDVAAEECLLDSLLMTPQPMAVLDDGVPCGIFGVVPCPDAGIGVLWMLGTPLLTSNRTEFLRGMVEFLDWYLIQYADLNLINHLHHTNSLHIRWLEYLGAEFGPPCPITGFRKFTLNVRTSHSIGSDAGYNRCRQRRHLLGPAVSG